MYGTNNTEKESRGPSENFVVFGTAFPETTEKDRRAGRSDAGQFVPVWKQEARDEQGRRRFHGAFTGGFSAGYFNTVGSKEGWEPSHFVSSRSARNERKEAKPEDYMDEEDLQDLAGTRKLVATEEFDILGGTERELAARKKFQAEQEASSTGLDLLGSSLMGMIGPPKDSVGIRLLRKMGWRPGQGIGPRTTRRHKDEGEESDNDDDFDTNTITFAPRDTPIENYQAKRDTYGLGYDLLSLVPEVAEMKRLRELAREKETNAAAIDSKNRSAFGVFGKGADAFGLGAFDENDGEEDDVYGGNDSAAKNFHHALYDDDEGGYTRDEIKAQGLKRKRENVSDSINKTKCSDGRPPLNGFIVSSQKQQIGNWHEPPNVPSDFNVVHITKVDNQQLKAPIITKESVFSFEERGNALGEKPIETRSVFDYMPQHSKDKLDQAVSWFIDLGKDKSQLSDFPTVPKDVANLALRGFMPFGDNLKKQARYKNYLENQAGRLTENGVPKPVLPIPEGLTYEAGMKEMDEFAKAARIFRPISAMMSGRFTSASETTKDVAAVNFEGGLKTEEQYRKEKEKMAQQMPEPEKKQLSQEAEAAAMNMFGNLTRTVKTFYPNKLVCKRFNVRNPHPNHDPTKDSDRGRTQAGSKDALSKEAMESLLNERLPLTFTSTSASPSTTTSVAEEDPMMSAVVPKPSDRKSENQQVTAPTTGIEVNSKTNDYDDDVDGGAFLDYERPSMDIFKAIFDDSDSDSDEENEGEKEQEKELKTLTVSAMVTVPDEEFIGPPVPPQLATADIPLERSTPFTESAPFRPMFKRASERKELPIPTANVISEEVVVQPFKPRSSVHKRRHVSISDDDNEEEEEKSRERSRHHKSSSSRHKSSKKSSSSSRKRSRSRDGSSRKRSRSPTEHKSSSTRHKKSKSSSSSKSGRDHPHHHRSSRKYEEEVDEFEGMWVEKEPVVMQKQDSSSSKKGRMRASDLW